MRPERVARAMAGLAWTQPDVVVLVVPAPHSGGVGVLVVNAEGQVQVGHEDAAARKLSSASYPICVATLGDEPRWVRYEGGDPVQDLGPADDLFLPFDEDGFPELGETPIARRDGPPEGWRVFRRSVDQGMESLLSCRFRPLERAINRALEGSSPRTRAFVARRKGRALNPPAEVGWPSYRSRD